MSAPAPSEQPAAVDLWTFPLDARGRFPELEALLAPDERARACRFVHSNDRESFTIGRALLRTILASYLDTAPGAIELANGPQGKPRLAASQSPLHFNLTHSGSLGTVAVSRSCEVGVDIEKVRPIEAGFSARFFSSAENAAIASLPETGQLQALFRCWSRKEAVLKTLGLGLLGDFKSFDVSVGAELTPSLTGLEAPWYLASFSPAEGYVGAVAARASAIKLTARDLAEVWP